MFLRNVYTALQPSRTTSTSSPWEPQISCFYACQSFSPGWQGPGSRRCGGRMEPWHRAELPGGPGNLSTMWPTQDYPIGRRQDVRWVQYYVRMGCLIFRFSITTLYLSLASVFLHWNVNRDSCRQSDWLRTRRPGFDSWQRYGFLFAPPLYPEQLWSARSLPGVHRGRFPLSGNGWRLELTTNLGLMPRL
jgi:hypothetical protein